MSQKEKEYKLYWIIVNKKEMTAEIHQLGVSDESQYNDQINYLTNVYSQNKTRVILERSADGKTTHLIAGL